MPQPSYRQGLDTEVFSLKALEQAHRCAAKRFEQEHVTPYLWQNPQLFDCRYLANDTDLSAWRLTVDTPEDLAFARVLYARLGDDFAFTDVVALLTAEPSLLAQMPRIERNLGLRLSRQAEE